MSDQNDLEKIVKGIRDNFRLGERTWSNPNRRDLLKQLFRLRNRGVIVFGDEMFQFAKNKHWIDDPDGMQEYFEEAQKLMNNWHEAWDEAGL